MRLGFFKSEKAMPVTSLDNPETMRRKENNMKEKARLIWERMTPRQQEQALIYYCNLVHQIHHNCEHGGKDFNGLKPAEWVHK